MAIFISLLRGINVSGQKKMLMADLKALYEELNFSAISTYIQSGNVVFSAENENKAEIAAQIEAKIAEKYGFKVPVLIRTASDLEKIQNYPIFMKEKIDNPHSIYFTFLSAEPSQTHQDKIVATNYLPDEYKIEGREIYLFCPNGYGNTKLSNSFFESKLKVIATTRNWKTLNVLLEMANALILNK